MSNRSNTSNTEVPTDCRRVNALAAGVAAAALTACAGMPMPAIPGLGNTPPLKTLSAARGSPAATQAASPSPSAPDNGVRPSITPPMTLTADEVKAMVIRSDPKACSATTDASPSEVAATYGKIAALSATRIAQAQLQGDAQMQRALDEMRQPLRELSRNTTWLPVQAERLVGDRIYAYNKLETYEPPMRQRGLLDKTITPMFEELKRFAADELKSPLNFELRVVRLDQSKVPSVIAGGIVLMPSGMFSALRDVDNPEPVIAFMLAHEFSHALRRHTTKMVQMSLIDSMTVASEYKKIANVATTGLSTLRNPEQMFSFSAQNVKSLMDHTCKSRNWFATMEQNQEFEADVCGSLLLKKLADRTGVRYSAVDGYSRYLAAGLATKLTPAEEGSCSVKTAHPEPKERMQNLQAYAPAVVGAR